MEPLLQRIRNGEILVADGAMGSLLFEKGLKSGECPESLNLTKPEILEEIAKLYLDAGSQIVQTNTFGGSPQKLSEYGLSDKTEQLNSAAVEIVRKSVGESAYVSGSCGPSGQILQPYGTADPGELSEGFVRQTGALIGAGVDVLCIETMTDLNEALLAVKAARRVSKKIPIMATMTFEKTPRGYFTMMGNTIEQAATTLAEAGADIVGSNCGNGLEIMIEVAAEFKKVTSLPLIIQSNAGMPQQVDGNLVYSESPDFFARRTKELIDIGVSIIGGCCGTTPETIRAICSVVNKSRAV